MIISICGTTSGKQYHYGGNVSSKALHLEKSYRRGMATLTKRGPTQDEVKNFPKLYGNINNANS